MSEITGKYVGVAIVGVFIYLGGNDPAVFWHGYFVAFGGLAFGDFFNWMNKGREE